MRCEAPRTRRLRDGGFAPFRLGALPGPAMCGHTAAAHAAQAAGCKHIICGPRPARGAALGQITRSPGSAARTTSPGESGASRTTCPKPQPSASAPLAASRTLTWRKKDSHSPTHGCSATTCHWTTYYAWTEDGAVPGALVRLRSFRSAARMQTRPRALTKTDRRALPHKSLTRRREELRFCSD
jgi:hypothetical protein